MAELPRQRTENALAMQELDAGLEALPAAARRRKPGELADAPSADAVAPAEGVLPATGEPLLPALPGAALESAGGAAAAGKGTGVAVAEVATGAGKFGGPLVWGGATVALLVGATSGKNSGPGSDNHSPASGGPAVAAGSEDDALISSSVPPAVDVDGNPVTYSVPAGTPPGVTFNSDGTYSYVPGPVDDALDDDETRVVTFDYVASDGRSSSAPAPVTITIHGVNDAPASGGNTTATGSENLVAGITGTVPSATDVDGDVLTFAAAGPLPAGVTLNSDGSFTVVPQAADQALDDGETREVVFRYVAHDGTTNSAEATVTVTITGANDAPVSGGHAEFTSSEDSGVIADRVPVAVDADDEPMTYTLLGSAPAGLVFAGDGTFSYFPQLADQALRDGGSRTLTFQYQVSDGTATSAPATVTLTITGVNDLPVSGGDASASGSEDVASIAGSVPAGTDLDDQILTYALASAAPAGVNFNTDGTFVVDVQPTDQALAEGESREVVFQYIVNDGAGSSTPATVTVTIAGVNDLPVAADQQLQVINDGTLLAGAFLAASDADAGDTLFHEVLVAPVHGTLTVTPAGEIQYLPDAAYVGPDSFTYRVGDGAGFSGQATVSITVVAPSVPTEGDDVLSGGSGADTIDGLGGNDHITGQAGDDDLRGGSGDDTLSGGAGNDALQGDAGSDVFRFARGDGNDTIVNNDLDAGAGAGAGLDVLEFGADIAPADVVLLRNGEDLVVAVPATADQLTVIGYFSADLAAPLDAIRFTDGSGAVLTPTDVAALAQVVTPTDGDDLLRGTSGDDVIDGLAGNDVIYGNAGNDTLAGSAGNDTLQGDAGNDTWLFGRGGGSDIIRSSDIDPLNGNGSGLDVIELGADISLSDVVFRRFGDDLTIIISGTTDQVVVPRYFSTDPAWQIDEIRFTDGSGEVLTPAEVELLGLLSGDGNDYLSGTAGDDVISGHGGDDTLYGNAGNDILDGGSGANLVYGGAGDDVLLNGDDGGILFGEAGNDVLGGGAGSEIMTGSGGDDTYVFGRGGGQDLILNSDADVGAGAGAGHDVVRLDADIAPGDIVLRRSEDHLVISITGSPDQLAVYRHFSGEPAWQIDEIRFTDGSGVVLTAADIQASVLVASAGDDYLGGTAADDVVDGLGGNDRIYGYAGNDRLTGGAGNDYLEGGAGDDTYVFRRADGSDAISNADSDTGAGLDVIELGADIALADVSVRRVGADLVMRINDTTDQVTVSGYFTDAAAPRIDEIRFMDGSGEVLTAAEIELLVMVATAGDDDLVGTTGDDLLDGLEGNDSISSGDGNDRLAGGVGDDVLSGGKGADTYVYRLGVDGFDSVADYFNEAGDDTNDFDIVEIHNAAAPPGVLVVHFLLSDGNGANPDLFIQVGADPAQGLLIADFFAHDGLGGVMPGPADIEQVVIYADSGFTEVARYTSQEIADSLNL